MELAVSAFGSRSRRVVMSRFLLPLAFAACLSVVLTFPAPPVVAAAPPVKEEQELVEKVRIAIKNGVEYLKSKQSPQGNWEGIVLEFLAGLEGGTTALVTLAMLNCGVKPDDPSLERALKYLHELRPKKTYVVALCNLVFAETREKKYLPRIEENVRWIEENALGWKGGKGQLQGWSYPMNDLADNSNTQYALLGLYAAKQAGAKVNEELWKAIQDYYTRTQRPDIRGSGYWTYYNDPKELGTISMTVAGVCGLLIAAMGLDQSEQKLDPLTGVAEKCGTYAENSAVAKGMTWVADNFSFTSPKSTFYNIYGIERLGRLSGQRFIGTHDWYREGCKKLVDLQEPNGSFTQGGKSVDGATLIASSFALLFLSKGRTPVLVSKFAWGDFQARGNGFIEVPPRGGPIPPSNGANWNRKHNDTRHIVEFCSQELFNNTPLSWQVYDARRRDFSDDNKQSGKEKLLEEVGNLLQSPVLYINGHGPIDLTPAQEEIIKTYVEEGGFLVAEACCGDPEFTKSFKAMMMRIFDNKSLFKKMPADHAILKILPGIVPTDFPNLEVIDRGCRTVGVFSPTPLAGYWEEAKYMPKDSRNPQNPGEKAFCLIRNIVAYATGMELPKPKLTSTHLELKKSEDSATRGKFKALQLKLSDDNDGPSPEGLRNVMGYLRDNVRLEVAMNSAVMAPYDENISGFKFMFMHGRKPLDWGEPQIETVQSNLQTGGLLLADAACGGYEQWKAYDKSFRAMCAKMFPDRKLVEITPTTPDGQPDPLFKIAQEAGINLKSVRCRRELPNDKGAEPEMHNYPVYLEGIKIDGNWVVIYSKYDLGCAIEGSKAADCLGHDKESAVRVAAAVALYSLKR
jgi:Domain of unknown function (DUF4159)